MHRSTLPLLLVSSAALCSCSAEDRAGGQTGEENFGCVDVASTVLPVDTVSRAGFSAAELLSVVEASHVVPLTWAGGRTTTATVALRFEGGETRFVEREWRDDDRELAVDPACEDGIDVEVLLDFETADGLFAERLPVVVKAASASRGTIFLATDPSAIAGGYEVTEVDAAAYEGIRLFFEVVLDGSGAHGTVTGQATQSSGGPDGTSSATSFDVATF